ncbi:MAG: hypothetical protein JO170_02110 [Verrucomicrobia bacterium]|nr:hypothetical protein [Verrucomicrobiota bacterium]
MKTIQTILAMTAFALAIENVQGHDFGNWGPEIQADLNAIWTRDIAHPIRQPEAQLKVEKQKLQKIWDALTPEQRDRFNSNLLEWEREVERPSDNSAENQVRCYRMRERRIKRWWSHGTYGPNEITNPYPTKNK